jgi:hypothetical protein
MVAPSRSTMPTDHKDTKNHQLFRAGPAVRRGGAGACPGPGQLIVGPRGCPPATRSLGLLSAKSASKRWNWSSNGSRRARRIAGMVRVRAYARPRLPRRRKCADKSSACSGSTLRAQPAGSRDLQCEASKEPVISWNWANQTNWSRWSHERLDASHHQSGDAVTVRPPKHPWTLKPLRRHPTLVNGMLSGPAGTHGVLGSSSVLGTRESPLLSIAPGKIARSSSMKIFKSPEHNNSSPSSLPHHLVDNDKFTKIYTVSKSLLINAADPMGNCSWTLPYPKTYEMLPELMAENGDWQSFKMIMTDLMFLWRKLQGGNQTELLHLYERASLALFAQRMHSERLEDFSEFFFHHLRFLSEEPNLLFAFAFASRNSYVKQTMLDLVDKNEKFINQWIEDLEQARILAAADTCRRRSLEVVL